MTFDPDKFLKDTEPAVEGDFDPDAFLADTEQPSQLEAAGRGALQGATLGFGEEIGAAALTPLEHLRQKIASLIPGTPEEVDAKLREQGFTGAVDESSAGDIYRELRDTARGADKAAQEAHGGTYLAGELAGGIAPAIVSGGGTAAATVAKTGLKEAALQAGLLGAKYGTAAGLGYSDAELSKDSVDNEYGQAALETGTGMVTGAIGGAAFPLAGKGLKGVTKLSGKGTAWVGDKVKSVPLLGDTLESFKMSAKGKGVLSQKSYENIIEDSKKIVIDKLAPFLVDQNNKYGRVIGDLVKKIKKVGNKDNITKDLSSLEKHINHLIKTKKVATEDGLKVLNETLDTISGFKKEIISIVPTKRVDTGVQTAIKNLEKQKNKIVATGKEVGEEFNFTEPKVDLETGIVTMFETRTGRPISAPIKTGEFTPIKIQNKSVFKELGIDETRGLSESLYEILEKAKKAGAKKSTRPIAKGFGIAKDASGRLADDSGVGNVYKQMSEKFSKLKDIDSILPKSLLDGAGDRESVNKVAQFLRKAEMEGISGDELRDKLGDLARELTAYDPKFAKSFLDASGEIAKRYDLARTARQSFGLNLGTGKALGVMAGGITGSGKKLVTDITKKVASPVTKAMDTLNIISKEKIGQVASKMVGSDNKGKQHIGNQLTRMLETEGVAKHQLTWALSQNPATRKLIENSLKEYSGGLENTLGVPSAGASEESYREPATMLKDDDLEKLKAALGYKESTNNYKAVNNIGYIGKYQFGAQTMENLGYLKPGSYKKYKNKALEMPELFTGKNDITNKEDFLNNEKLQDSEASRNLKLNYKYLKRKGVDVDKLPDEEVAGLLATSHLLGAGGAKKMYEGKDSKDALGTTGTEYYNLGKESIKKDIPEISPEPKLQDGGIAEKPSEGIDTKAVEREIDRVNQQKSSGETTPVDQLDALLEKIDALNMDQSSKDELEHEAITMNSYSDGEALKQKIRSLLG